jgi:hypothetical protein
MATGVLDHLMTCEFKTGAIEVDGLIIMISATRFLMWLPKRNLLVRVFIFFY